VNTKTPHPLFRYFHVGHLPPHLQAVSVHFGECARALDALLPEGAEKTVCLRKLLEAKDAGVRSALDMGTADAATALVEARKSSP
jgi:hypothetical protein